MNSRAGMLLALAAATLMAVRGQEVSRLHAAAAAGDTETLGPLLLLAGKPGSDGVAQLLESTDNQGMTALMIAAREGHASFIEMLLAAGAHPDALCVSEGRTARERTALFWAVSHGHADSTRALLAAGAAPNMRNRDGETPLVVAVTRDGISPECAAVESELLVRQAAVDLADAQGRTPLMLAAKLGRFRAVQVLLSAGAAVNRLASGGESALMFAAAKGHVNVVRELLDAGADAAAKRHGPGDFQASIGAKTARGFAAANHREEAERVLAAAEQKVASQAVPDPEKGDYAREPSADRETSGDADHREGKQRGGGEQSKHTFERTHDDGDL